MMTIRLTARDRQALGAGASVVVLILLLSRVVPAFVAWRREAVEDAMVARQELARANLMLREQEVRRVRWAGRSSRNSVLAHLLLVGDTPATAGAQLVSMISDMADAADVRIGSVQLRGDTATNTHFRRVGAIGDALGDVRGVSSFIASVEGGAPLLVFRALTIMQPEPGAPDAQREALRVEFEIEGLIRNPAERHTR